MFLFLKKRKEENLKPLTEKEIQEKLYGHFYTGTLGDDETSPDSAERQVEVGELFKPPVEIKEQVQSAPDHQPSNPRIKPEFLGPIAKPRNGELFRFGSNFQKISWWFKISSMKKPRWIEKLERIPISRIAVTFFALVLILVVVRALAQVVFNVSPNFMRGIKIKMRSLEKAVVVPETKVPEKTAVAKEVIQVTLPPAVPKRFYTIQMIIYEDFAPAQRLIDRLKSRNLDAFAKAIKNSRGKERYQVFLGHFLTYAEAQSKLAQYRKSNLLADFPDSFVRPQVE